MNVPEEIQSSSPSSRQISTVPKVGELVQVRSRRWLVEEVIEPKILAQTYVVRLSCADDDAQGQSLEVLWDYELDRLILKEEGWAHLAAKGFDQPRQFAAFLHTLRWNCVTATDSGLFQATRTLHSEFVTFLKVGDFFARKLFSFSTTICAKSKKSQTLSEAQLLTYADVSSRKLHTRPSSNERA